MILLSNRITKVSFWHWDSSNYSDLKDIIQIKYEFNIFKLALYFKVIFFV